MGRGDREYSSNRSGGNSRGGALHLARIHGTEEDRVNCPFYFKIGACRHGDRCSRQHHMPAFSPTILIKHIYQHPVRLAELRAAERSMNPAAEAPPVVDERLEREKAFEDFLQFYENMYDELSNFGRLDALNVCDNLGDHMIGHVYAKFTDEEEAADALSIMNGRFYDGRKMEVEFSPVTDFREARCRDFDEETCSRGGFCNFMHIKPVPRCLIGGLEQEAEMERRRDAMERERHRHRDSRRSDRRGHRRSRSESDSESDGSRRRSRGKEKKKTRRSDSRSASRSRNSRSTSQK